MTKTLKEFTFTPDNRLKLIELIAQRFDSYPIQKTDSMRDSLSRIYFLACMPDEFLSMNALNYKDEISFLERDNDQNA